MVGNPSYILFKDFPSLTCSQKDLLSSPGKMLGLAPSPQPRDTHEGDLRREVGGGVLG